MLVLTNSYKWKMKLIDLCAHQRVFTSCHSMSKYHVNHYDVYTCIYNHILPSWSYITLFVITDVVLVSRDNSAAVKQMKFGS